jgi:UDP-N-acetylglucosamine 2-epimerase (non-hydrolysing)
LRILTTIGTRPEAIKMYPIIDLLNQDKDIEHKICISGQHEDLINQMLANFELKADYKLEVMQDKQPIEELFGKIIRETSLIIEKYNPNLIIVHGDTLTTFATTLAGFFKKIDVAHVEAGLRTNNIYSPWPEEANRRLTAVLARYHFAPTTKSSQNLIKEGIDPERILVTGNTIVDMVNKVTRGINVKARDTGGLKEFDFIKENKKIILVTCHRRENIGEGIQNICKAIIKISQLEMDLKIVIPVHHNPYIKDTIIE